MTMPELFSSRAIFSSLLPDYASSSSTPSISSTTLITSMVNISSLGLQIQPLLFLNTTAGRSIPITIFAILRFLLSMIATRYRFLGSGFRPFQSYLAWNLGFCSFIILSTSIRWIHLQALRLLWMNQVWI